MWLAPRASLPLSAPWHRRTRTEHAAAQEVLRFGRRLAGVRGENGWGTFLVVWTLIVVTIDNVLRPLLIKRGADLPCS